MSRLLNLQNNNWQTGHYPLILGDHLGLHDGINVPYSRLEELYQRQRAIDWDWSEVSLLESRMDIDRAPKYITDMLVKNLSYQWELDSLASRSFGTLLAPFITNTEFWKAQCKNQEIEIVHADTYSEIVRQCIPDVKTLLANTVNNDKITARSLKVVEALEDLQRAGAEYVLGIVKNDQKLFNRVFKGIFAMYLAERLQFMSSFATTFITAEQGFYIGICKLVQKIAIDEITCHAETLGFVLAQLLATDPRAQIALSDNRAEFLSMYNAMIGTEHTFSKYILSEGRKSIGLTVDLLNDWVDFNAYFAGLPLQLITPVQSKINPLPFMSDWLDIDSFQNANQEADNTNYFRIHAADDLNEEIFDF